MIITNIYLKLIKNYYYLQQYSERGVLYFRVNFIFINKFLENIFFIFWRVLFYVPSRVYLWPCSSFDFHKKFLRCQCCSFWASSWSIPPSPRSPPTASRVMKSWTAASASCSVVFRCSTTTWCPSPNAETLAQRCSRP